MAKIDDILAEREAVAKARKEIARRKKISKKGKGTKKKRKTKNKGKKRKKKIVTTTQTKQKPITLTDKEAKSLLQVNITAKERRKKGAGRRAGPSYAEQQAQQFAKTNVADLSQLRQQQRIASDILGYTTQSRDPLNLRRAGRGRYNQNARKVSGINPETQTGDIVAGGYTGLVSGEYTAGGGGVGQQTEGRRIQGRGQRWYEQDPQRELQAREGGRKDDDRPFPNQPRFNRRPPPRPPSSVSSDSDTASISSLGSISTRSGEPISTDRYFQLPQRPANFQDSGYINLVDIPPERQINPRTPRTAPVGGRSKSLLARAKALAIKRGARRDDRPSNVVGDLESDTESDSFRTISSIGESVIDIDEDSSSLDTASSGTERFVDSGGLIDSSSSSSGTDLTTEGYRTQGSLSSFAGSDTSSSSGGSSGRGGGRGIIQAPRSRLVAPQLEELSDIEDNEPPVLFSDADSSSSFKTTQSDIRYGEAIRDAPYQFRDSETDASDFEGQSALLSDEESIFGQDEFDPFGLGEQTIEEDERERRIGFASRPQAPANVPEEPPPPTIREEGFTDRLLRRDRFAPPVRGRPAQDQPVVQGLQQPPKIGGGGGAFQRRGGFAQAPPTNIPDEEPEDINIPQEPNQNIVRGMPMKERDLVPERRQQPSPKANRRGRGRPRLDLTDSGIGREIASLEEQQAEYTRAIDSIVARAPVPFRKGKLNPSSASEDNMSDIGLYVEEWIYNVNEKRASRGEELLTDAQEGVLRQSAEDLMRVRLELRRKRGLKQQRKKKK